MVVGKWYEGIHCSLENNIANFNHKKKQSNHAEDQQEPCETNSSNGSNKSAATKRKVTVKDSFGCIAHQPEDLPDNETETSQTEKQNWLASQYEKPEKARELKNQ